MKKSADVKLAIALSMPKGTDNFASKCAYQEAIMEYGKALKFVQGVGEATIMVHRELIRAYFNIALLVKSTQMRVYFFGLELESVNSIMYYSSMGSIERKTLIANGSSYHSRLRLLLSEELSENKSDYLEKIFASMNPSNVDFRCRLAWSISKAYYKQTLKHVEKKDWQKANSFCQRATQFVHIFEETLLHNMKEFDELLAFKTEDKRVEYAFNLEKQQSMLRAELEFARGDKMFADATFVSENLDMDLLYDSLDSYSSASKVGFALKDIELEARCEARIAKVYYMAMKKESKAATHFHNAIRLSYCLQGAPFTDILNQPWFK